MSCQNGPGREKTTTICAEELATFLSAACQRCMLALKVLKVVTSRGYFVIIGPEAFEKNLCGRTTLIALHGGMKGPAACVGFFSIEILLFFSQGLE